MAQLSGWWTTDAGGDGDDQVVSYTQAHMSEAAAILAACSGFEGVAPGYTPDPPSGASGLIGTYTGVNTVAIGLGGAVVDGKWYYNDASVNMTIPSAGAGTIRLDRIVLRCSWADFDCDLTVLTGTAVALPAITQTSGTTYDIKLYACSVTDGGVVTLTDERVMASPIKFRQGGSATDWNTQGTTDYVTGTTVIQSGVIRVSVGAGDADDSTAVTFPVAFSAKPNVLVGSFGEITSLHTVSAITILTTGFTAYVYRDNTTNPLTADVAWFAIGPK